MMRLNVICFCDWLIDCRGAKGDPVDNRPLVSYLKDEELAKKVYEKVNEFNKSWIATAS